MGSESQAGAKLDALPQALSLLVSSLAGPPRHEARLKMTEQCQKQGVPVRHSNTPPAENLAAANCELATVSAVSA